MGIPLATNFNLGSTLSLDARLRHPTMEAALAAEFKVQGVLTSIAGKQYVWNGTTYVPFKSADEVPVIDAYTKTEADEKFVDSSEMNSALQSAIESIPSIDAYTKTESDEKFVDDDELQSAINALPSPVDSYTKTESDNKFALSSDIPNDIQSRINSHNTNSEAHQDIRQAYLPVSGGTVVGALQLGVEPTIPTHAVTKKYVDEEVGTVKSQAFSYTGFVSQVEPSVDVREGNLWYTGLITDPYPWNVYVYSNGAWSTDTISYTATALDLITNLDEADSATGTNPGVDPTSIQFNQEQFVQEGDILCITPALLNSLTKGGKTLLSNQSGQVKVRFTNLTATGFVSNTDSILSLRSAEAIVQDSPTTLWSQQAIDDATNTYETGFFIQGSDETKDRLRENNIVGQVHRWRVTGNYSNKDVSSLGRMRCFITNPDTGFKVSSSVILPSGITNDDFTFEFTSIADNDSLAIGRGYNIGFTTSFDDATLTVTVNSIVRISEAIDNLRA